MSLRRHWQDLPPLGRELLVATSCMLVVVVVLFPDVLFRGRTTTTSAYSAGVLGSPPHAGYPEGALLERNPYLRDPLASAIASEPAAEYAARVPADPGLVLWDGYRSLGQPVLATGNPQVTSPIRWPLALAPTPVGWDAFTLLRLVATGVAVHLLAWRLGRSRWASATAAVVAAAGGFTALHVNSVHVDQLLALAVALHVAVSLARSRSVLHLAAAGVAGYVVIVADNLQAGVLGLALVGAFTLHLLRREGVDRVRATALTGAALVLPLLLAAPVLVPMVELAGSPFNDGLSVHRHLGERLVGLLHLPPEALADLLLPYLNRATETAGLDINGGFGMVVVALALLGSRQRSPHRLFLVGAALALLLKLYGLPLLNDLGRLPVLSGMNFILYTAAPLQLVVALLAGAGVDRLRAPEVTWREPVAVSAVVAVAALALTAWRSDGSLPLGLYGTHLVLLGAFAATAAATTVETTRWREVGLAGVVLAQVALIWLPHLGAVALDRPTEAVLGLEVIDRPLRSEPFTAPPFVTRLQELAEPGDRIVARGGRLFPNSAGVFLLEDLRGTSGFTVARFHGLVEHFVDRRDPWRFDGREWEDLVHVDADPRLPEVLDLVGVEWVVSHTPLPAEVLRDRYPEFVETFVGPHARIYHNQDALPRAFLVHEAVGVDTADEAFAAMEDPALDLRRTAVLETAELPPLAQPASAGTVEITGRSATGYEVVVDTAAPGVLVIADTYYPGWQARVDGEAAPVLPAYGTLRAVAVPAGRSVVELDFRPRSVLVGVVLAGAAVLLLAALAITSRRLRRADDAERPSRDRATPVSA